MRLQQEIPASQPDHSGDGHRINPGSGVGNHRHGLNEKSIGVPVIAIGVPTVVDAATIVNDTMFNLITAMNQSSELKTLGNTLGELNETEKYELIRELLSPNLNTMFVTPKDIDESVKRLSFYYIRGVKYRFDRSQHFCIMNGNWHKLYYVFSWL